MLGRFKRCLPDDSNNEPFGEMEGHAPEQSTDEASAIKKLEFASLRHEIQTQTSKGFPSALNVSRVYVKVKWHDRCS